MEKFIPVQERMMLNYYPEVDFSILKNKTIIGVNGLKEYSNSVIFQLSNGKKLCMSDFGEIRSSVYIEEIYGDIDDIIDSEILLAECVTQSDKKYTLWTFYKLSTINGSITLRWCGEADNGYYSVRTFCHFID